MIIELLFKLVFGLIDLLLSFLPSLDFELTMPDLTFFKEIFGMLDYFFPVATLISVIGVLLAFQNIKFLSKIFMFIIKRIPFLG